MSNCSNLCTAAKCAELEARINKLEAKLEEHLKQNIPEAHRWDGSFNLDFTIFEKILTLDLYIDNIDTKSASIELPFVTQTEFDSHVNKNIPEAHEWGSNFDLDLTVSDNILTLTLDIDSIGSKSDSIKLPFVTQTDFNSHISTKVNSGSSLAHTYEPKISHSLTISDNQKEFITLRSEISVEEKSANDSVNIPINNFNSNLKIDGTLTNKDLSLFISDGNSSDSAKIPLFFVLENDFQDHLKSDIPEAHNYEPDMNCDELANLITSTANQTQDLVQSEATETQDIIRQESDVLQSVIDAQPGTNNDNGFKINRIYSILGGNYWENPELSIKAESNLRNTGQQQFTDEQEDKATPINNILDLIKSYHSISYHRAGYHRLPATLIESIIKPSQEEDETVTISDSLSFQEWIFKQIDAISGQYPIKFDYKIKNENGEEKIETIEIPNSAEALTQILAILLAVSEESDMNLNATMRCLAEARSGANSAILAYDFARANAEYLGYRGKERKKEIDISFTPGSQTIRESLQPSKQKLIGWEFDDKESLIELIKKILFSSEIIKAAMYIPFNSQEDRITGDAIKETIEQEKNQQEEKWEKFKNIINNPTGKYKVPRPKGNLKDLTVDKD